MDSRFKPDAAADRASESPAEADFNEDEPSELSEYRFAASLEKTPEHSRSSVEKEVQQHLEPSGNDQSSWRQEVSAKLNNYKARKQPREPRYPSLQLKFEDRDWARSSQNQL